MSFTVQNNEQDNTALRFLVSLFLWYVYILAFGVDTK
jgi:hypothetical protein